MLRWLNVVIEISVLLKWQHKGRVMQNNDVIETESFHSELVKVINYHGFQLKLDNNRTENAPK